MTTRLWTLKRAFEICRANSYISRRIIANVEYRSRRRVALYRNNTLQLRTRVNSRTWLTLITRFYHLRKIKNAILSHISRYKWNRLFYKLDKKFKRYHFFVIKHWKNDVWKVICMFDEKKPEVFNACFQISYTPLSFIHFNATNNFVCGITL